MRAIGTIESLACAYGRSHHIVEKESGIFYKEAEEKWAVVELSKEIGQHNIRTASGVVMFNYFLIFQFAGFLF